MFLTFWIGWAFVGLAVATWLFAWSIKTRQFENSRRASLLPFDDVSPVATRESEKKGRTIFYTVLGLFALAFGLIIITISLVL